MKESREGPLVREFDNLKHNSEILRSSDEDFKDLLGEVAVILVKRQRTTEPTSKPNLEMRKEEPRDENLDSWRDKDVKPKEINASSTTEMCSNCPSQKEKLKSARKISESFKNRIDYLEQRRLDSQCGVELCLQLLRDGQIKEAERKLEVILNSYIKIDPSHNNYSFYASENSLYSCSLNDSVMTIGELEMTFDEEAPQEEEEATSGLFSRFRQSWRSVRSLSSSFSIKRPCKRKSSEKLGITNNKVAKITHQDDVSRQIDDPSISSQLVEADPSSVAGASAVAVDVDSSSTAGTAVASMTVGIAVAADARTETTVNVSIAMEAEAMGAEAALPGVEVATTADDLKFKDLDHSLVSYSKITPFSSTFRTPRRLPNSTVVNNTPAILSTPINIITSPPLENLIRPTPLKGFGSPHGHFSNRSSIKFHQFTVRRTFRLEFCDECSRRILFPTDSYKCVDCKATCHQECKDSLPLPCIQIVTVPGGLKKGLKISDFAPMMEPMIPALIVHCANEVERRGLNTCGIYRVSGLEKDIRHIRDRFMQGKSIPKLSTFDIHSICSTIKSFLRKLKEPLIPISLWKDFISATAENDPEDVFPMLYQALNELPQPNRDTLAFLIAHLQRVAECENTKMHAENLATVFGPTIVGHSLQNSDNVGCMVKEVALQKRLMEFFLKVPSDYWRTFLEPNERRRSLFLESNQKRRSSILEQNHKRFSFACR